MADAAVAIRRSLLPLSPRPRRQSGRRSARRQACAEARRRQPSAAGESQGTSQGKARRQSQGRSRSQSRSQSRRQAGSRSQTAAKAQAAAKPATNRGRQLRKARQAAAARSAGRRGVAAGAAEGRSDGAAADRSPAATGQPQAIPAPANTIVTAAAIDVAAVKRAIELVRNRKQTDASEVKKNISDPAAKKLVEWVILRSDDSGADFARYAAFIAANPNWPSIVTLRRKAEAAAFQEQPANATGAGLFLAVAAALRQGPLRARPRAARQGDRKDAEALVREAWRNDGFSQDVESRVLETFGEFLTHADHKARMDRRLYEKDDTEAGLRAAARLGGNEPAIAKARIAMLEQGRQQGRARRRAGRGPQRHRLQVRPHPDAAARRRTRRGGGADQDHPQAARPEPRSRRMVDRAPRAGPQAARRRRRQGRLSVVRDATPPDTRQLSRRASVHGRLDRAALPARSEHRLRAFHARSRRATTTRSRSRAAPIGLGRAAEALQQDRRRRARTTRRPRAIRPPITARSPAPRPGSASSRSIPSPPSPARERAKATSSDVVRAAELLYAVEARDLAWTMMADLGDKSTDVGVLAVLAELTAKYRDARGMLLLGKLALARGYRARPRRLPDHRRAGLHADRPAGRAGAGLFDRAAGKLVQSEDRLERQRARPDAGHARRPANTSPSKFKVTFDQKRLLSDSAYNVQMGSAELGDVIKDYRGSYIMAFAAYNAGRGRVKEWVARYGDPRDPKVDPIDWVERIPFSETRNYVQRVMENVQVYRVRFGGSSRLLIEADLRRGSRGQLSRDHDPLPCSTARRRSRWPSDGPFARAKCRRHPIGSRRRKVHGGQRHRRASRRAAFSSPPPTASSCTCAATARGWRPACRWCACRA